MGDYDDFLASKALSVVPSGIEDPPDIAGVLFDFQRDITRWALRIGKAAIWADCGLGKSWMALEWSRAVVGHTGKPVLILAPLAVSQQFIDEHAKLGSDCPISVARDSSSVCAGINVCNYERLHKLDPEVFGGVVLDESSILKDYTGKTRNQLIDVFAQTGFKLCCTATPSPNDVMELANHAEFLGTMTRSEMLAMFFVHDGGETQKWRLKGHAVDAFWQWVCSWAVGLRTPGDFGYPDDGFRLPPLNIHEHVVTMPADMARHQGTLFAMDAQTLSEQRLSRRLSLDDRIEIATELANSNAEPWIVWCDLNLESQALAASINGAVEVTGSMSSEEKEARMMGFSRGAHRVMVSKPSIAGWGMNWQHCNNVAFVGLTHSFEAWYQAIRRSYRFGQTRPVECHMIFGSADGAVASNLKRKQSEAEALAASMSSNMSEFNKDGIRATARGTAAYDARDRMAIPPWLTAEA